MTDELMLPHATIATEKVALSEPTQHLITKENFDKLRQLQTDIFKAIEISFPVRKLANLLITEDNLQHLKRDLLNRFVF
jgi:hypothetical protein